MSSFVALYRGETIGIAKMIAVSADPSLVAHVAADLLDDPRYADKDETDPVLIAVSRGRRRALKLIQTGKADDYA